MSFVLKMGILITMIIGLFLQSGCSNNNCNNSEIQRLRSPDGRLEAVLFTRDCGATTKKSYQLSIVNKDKEVSGKGNVYVSYDKFIIEWEGNQSLVLKTSSSRSDVFKKEENVKGISIIYK